MNSFLQIEGRHIEQLNNEQFVRLLRILLYLEASNIGVPFSKVSVPLNITASDDGEDASIEWELFDKNVKKSDWIQKNYTVFQSKAYNIQPVDCNKELFEKPKANQTSKKKKKIFKKALLNVFKKKGSYILFVKSSYTPKAINNRIKAIKNGLKEIRKNIDNINVDIYDANKISIWSNKYPQAALYISSCNTGFKLSPNFKTWDELSKYDTFSGNFIANDKLNEHLTGILQCSSGTKNILRIIGLSGLGKTRLILEAFRPSGANDLKKELLSNSFIYYNSFDSKSTLIENLHFIISLKTYGTLIVDNCDIELHSRLSEEINRKDSKLNLITIDFIEDSPYKPSDYNQIKIENTDYLDVVPKMLANAFPEIPAQDREKISIFVNGFPMLAYELGRQMKSNNPNLGVITAENIVNKIIWGRGKIDKNEKAVLTSCSIFDKFGFYEEYEDQMKFISSNKILCKISGSKEKLVDFFKKVCKKFMGRGILEKRGRFLVMKPKPLAVTLAAEWWRGIDKKAFDSLFEKLKENGLDIYLSDQMRYLDFLPEAKEFVLYLSSDKGPFGKAETLNTEEGSRFFRSLVEVNPQATCDTLYRLYNNKSIKYIKEEVNKGRRDLVWGLQKLCWRKETFEKAAKVLMIFAVGENENWANNATGIFKHLFQTLLPGTEASLDVRFEILKYGMSKSDDYKKITIKAIRSALKTHFFTRDVWAENQGMSKTLKDYTPTYQERNEYWEKCLNLLKNEWSKDSSIKSEIETIIAESIRGLSSQAFGNVILPFVEEICQIKKFDWNEARDNLKLTLKYEKRVLLESDLKMINELINKLTPEDIFKQYEIYINNPGWEVTEDENGKYVDGWKINTDKYVEKLTKEEFKWKELIDVFYVGKQIQGYYFGEELGKTLKSKNEFDDFIETSILKLRSLKFEERNITVFIGFLNGLNDISKNNQIINKFLDSEELFKNSFSLASGVEYESSLLKRFIELANKKKEHILDLIAFKYCRAFDKFSDEELNDFINSILDFQGDGIYVSFALLYNIFWRNKSRFNSYKSLFRKILLTEDIIFEVSKKDHLGLFEWKEIVEKIIENEIDNELALHIVKQIIDLVRKDGLRSNMYIQDVLGILMNKYFLQVWPLIGDALLEDSFVYIHLEHMLGYRIYFENENFPEDLKKRERERNGILFKSNNEIIFNWCKNNSPLAPVRLVRFLPIFDEHEKQKWHPFTLSFINEFGNESKVLSGISAKMGTYSWTGSIVPLLEDEKALYEQLLDHNLSNVRKWAELNIEYLNKSIKRESNENQELYM